MLKIVWLLTFGLIGCGSLSSAAEPPITSLALLDSQHLVIAARSEVKIVTIDRLKTVDHIANIGSLVHKIIVRDKQVYLFGGTPAESSWVAKLQLDSSSENLTSKLTSVAGIPVLEDCIYDAAISPDGQRILLASLDGQAVAEWLSSDLSNDLSNAQQHSAVKFAGHSGGVTGAVWLNNDAVATCSRDTSIRVWRADSGELLRTLSQHTGEVTLLARSPESPFSTAARPLIASAGLDRTIRFWQPTIGRLVRFCRLENQTATCMTWANDGSALLVGTSSGLVVSIDPATAEVTARWQVSEDWITSLVISEQQQIFFGTAEGRVAELQR